MVTPTPRTVKLAASAAGRETSVRRPSRVSTPRSSAETAANGVSTPRSSGHRLARGTTACLSAPSVGHSASTPRSVSRPGSALTPRSAVPRLGQDLVTPSCSARTFLESSTTGASSARQERCTARSSAQGSEQAARFDGKSRYSRSCPRATSARQVPLPRDATDEELLAAASEVDNCGREYDCVACAPEPHVRVHMTRRGVCDNPQPSELMEMRHLVGLGLKAPQRSFEKRQFKNCPMTQSAVDVLIFGKDVDFSGETQFDPEFMEMFQQHAGLMTKDVGLHGVFKPGKRQYPRVPAEDMVEEHMTLFERRAGLFAADVNKANKGKRQTHPPPDTRRRIFPPTQGTQKRVAERAV